MVFIWIGKGLGLIGTLYGAALLIVALLFALQIDLGDYAQMIPTALLRASPTEGIYALCIGTAFGLAAMIAEGVRRY